MTLKELLERENVGDTASAAVILENINLEGEVTKYRVDYEPLDFYINVVDVDLCRELCKEINDECLKEVDEHIFDIMIYDFEGFIDFDLELDEEQKAILNDKNTKLIDRVVVYDTDKAEVAINKSIYATHSCYDVRVKLYENNKKYYVKFNFILDDNIRYYENPTLIAIDKETKDKIQDLIKKIKNTDNHEKQLDLLDKILELVDLSSLIKVKSED